MFILILILIFLFLPFVSAQGNDTNIEIRTNDLVKYYQNDSQFEFNIIEDNAAVSNAEVNFNINGQNYTRFSDVGGNGKFSINLIPGNYSIITSFKNTSVINNIEVLSFLNSRDVVKFYRNDSQYYCQVLNKDGSICDNSPISFNINGVFYDRFTNASGIAKLNINLIPNSYIITASFRGLSISNNITVLSFLESNDLEKYYRNDSQYYCKVLDSQGNPLENTTISMNINGVFYSRNTNASGIARLNINLASGTYIITTYFNNLAISNVILVLDRLHASDIESVYGNGVEFPIWVVDKQGNNLVNSLVTFNINGDIYTNYTNSGGQTSIYLNKNAGNYVITCTVDDVSCSNLYTVKNAYEITYYNWNSGADVLKNSLIKNNLPTSEIINQIIELAKLGTPMVTFKGGDGKKVFLTAGVHGNELSSQVAILQLIKYLEVNPIDGTVYIIPFVQPKATSANVRNYMGVNLNSVANVDGTISNNIVKLILEFKCDSYGDFHCTQPNGVPGRNVAMGSYSPMSESASISYYISNKCGVASLIYSVAGSDYPGALEDAVNLRGVPAITCEVLTPHGTIAAGSVETSFSMMKALLLYHNCI